eukprot:578875-Ditylum_brightwellii.AAC.1
MGEEKVESQFKAIGGGRCKGETDAMATTTAIPSSPMSSKGQKESSICDVESLYYGQTIHLVPQPNGSSLSSSGNDGFSSEGDYSESLGVVARSTSTS